MSHMRAHSWQVLTLAALSAALGIGGATSLVGEARTECSTYSGTGITNGQLLRSDIAGQHLLGFLHSPPRLH